MLLLFTMKLKSCLTVGSNDFGGSNTFCLVSYLKKNVFIPYLISTFLKNYPNHEVILGVILQLFRAAGAELR